MKTMSFTMHEDTASSVRDEAEKRGITMSALVEQWCRQALKMPKKKRPKQGRPNKLTDA